MNKGNRKLENLNELNLPEKLEKLPCKIKYVKPILSTNFIEENRNVTRKHNLIPKDNFLKFNIKSELNRKKVSSYESNTPSTDVSEYDFVGDYFSHNFPMKILGTPKISAANGDR